MLANLLGTLKAEGKFNFETVVNLVSGSMDRIVLDATRFPVRWLAETILRLDTSNEFSNRTGLTPENVNDSLLGFFDAKIGTTNGSDSWSWSARSNEISIYGKPFKSVEAIGSFGQQLYIKRLSSNLPGRGFAKLQGDWCVTNDEGTFDLQWENADLVSLLDRRFKLPESFGAYSNGQLEACFRSKSPVFTGLFELIEPKIFGGTWPDQSFDIETVDDRIVFASRSNPAGPSGLLFKGQLEMHAPFSYSVSGGASSMPLSTDVFDELSGRLSTEFSAEGIAEPWQVRSDGKFALKQVSYRREAVSDVNANWHLDSKSLDKQHVVINALGGSISLVGSESGFKEDLTFVADEIDASQLSVLGQLPVSVSGIISGNAVLRNWQSPDDRSVEAKLNSPLVKIGDLRLTGVEGDAKLDCKGQLDYEFNSRVLDGRLRCVGGLVSVLPSSFLETDFPLEVRLDNARLSPLVQPSLRRQLGILQDLDGRVSAAMKWTIHPGEFPVGTGKVLLNDAKLKNQIFSRAIASDVHLDKGVMRFDNFSADLQQGEISGQATIPLIGTAAGSYQLDVRKFNLGRLVQILLDEPFEADGLLNARLSGRIGQTITGRGTMGLDRAGLFGVADQSMQLPIRYEIQPQSGAAHIEIPRSRFKLFRGNVNGYAKLYVGSRTRLDSKFDVANIDAYNMIHALTGFTGSGNGKLNGHLELSGRNIDSPDDLVGIFQGKLSQSNAFSFPLLDQIGRVFGSATAWRNRKFESETIDLTLNRGRVEVRNFRLQNSLASIAVTGNAWLSGRLDLDVAARIESLDQPSLLQQFASSPLARVTGSPASFFAQAAEFLSERIIFVDVGGNVSRPQIRLNPGKQLKEEAIRYFLRGSQILPNANGQNN